MVGRTPRLRARALSACMYQGFASGSDEGGIAEQIAKLAERRRRLIDQVGDMTVHRPLERQYPRYRCGYRPDKRRCARQFWTLPDYRRPSRGPRAHQPRRWRIRVRSVRSPDGGAFEAMALTGDIIVIPQYGELGTRARELLCELCDLGTGASSDSVGPLTPDDEPRNALPIVPSRAHAGIAEHQAKDVPFAGRNFGVVGQGQRRCRVPRQNVPCGCLDEGEVP